MKKKILFVINSLGVGGAEKSLTSLLNTMDGSRYQVDLLMFHPGGMFIKLLPAYVHVLPQLGFLKSNQSPPNPFLHPKYLCARAAASIGLRLNKGKNKLHDAQCYWKYAGWALGKLPGEYDAAIAWGQGNPTHYVAEKVRAQKKIAFINADYEAVGHKKEFDTPFYESFDYIAAVSDHLAEIMRNVFPEMTDKIVTVYDINNAEMIRRMAEAYNPFEAETALLKIVTVGRLVPQKGYDLLTKAARILKDKNLNFRWYIVGEGESRKAIERDLLQYAIQDKVVLVGAKENPYVYMKNADIYVQTSRFEGYCLTLGEARMLNTPVISTSFQVVCDQLKDGENGLIVELQPEAIAGAIIRLWEDAALRQRIVGNLEKEKKGNTEEIEKLYALLGG